MKLKGVTFAIALLSSVAAVCVSGVVAAALQDWFGVSDLYFLLFWFLPLGLATALISSLVIERASRWSVVARYLVSLGIGLPLGFLWTLCVATFLGPWWGTVSLPALLCWMAGAILGIAGGLLFSHGSSLQAKIANALILLGLAVAVPFISKPLSVGLSHDQTLTVRFLKWTPSGEPLTIESERPEPLSDTALSLLRVAKITGRVRVMWGGSVHGRGPEATALILLESPVGTPVSLQQPDRSMALYVQRGKAFAIYPSRGRTLDRTIMLSTRDSGVWYSVEDAGGGVQSGPAFNW